MDPNVEKFENLIEFLKASGVKSYSTGPQGTFVEFWPEPETSFVPTAPGYIRQADRIKNAEEAEAKEEQENPRTPYKHPALGGMINFNYED